MPRLLDNKPEIKAIYFGNMKKLGQNATINKGKSVPTKGRLGFL